MFIETGSIRSPETGVMVVIVTMWVLGSDSASRREKYLLLTIDPYLQHKHCRSLKATGLMCIFITTKNIVLQLLCHMNKLKES